MVLAVIPADSGYSVGRRELMRTDAGPIRVLTVDDHPLLRDGIAAPINAESDMKLVCGCVQRTGCY
jgi:hypothetical protein